MWKKNHSYNHSQARQYYQDQPINKREARVDIRAKGFWNRQQNAFFDVRVFHPNASSYRNTEIPALYRQQENAKKREYGDRIREGEYAVFTPLVFPTTVGPSFLQPSHINDWQNYWQRSENQNTASLLHGCDVAFPLP